MAKTKKPENESPHETEIRHTFEKIVNSSNRSEKTSWNRKMDNMVKILLLLKPIEDKILDLIAAEKTPLMDEVSKLREVMIAECVHPYEYLTISDEDIITCKFCNRRINSSE